MVDSGGLAKLLTVSPGWVRAHAEELGGVRLGGGPKAPWRFDVAEALASLRAGQRSPPEGVAGDPKKASPVERRRTTGRRVPLLEKESEHE